MNETRPGKICITGAGSGIGRATALRFSTSGADLFLVDINEQALTETAEMVTGRAGKVASLAGNVADEQTSEEIVKQCLDALGGLDCYFANAGIAGPQQTIDQFSLADLRAVLDVNLLGAFLAVKYGGNAIMQGGGGSIILTASVAGTNANSASAIYSASKAGVISLTKTAAQEFAGSGVRVNAVCPGLIETSMTQPIFDYARKSGKQARLGYLNPCRRAGQAEEIADAVYFLAGADASYINGHVLVVDGGLSSSLPYAPQSALIREEPE